jgi:hypothetical protein
MGIDTEVYTENWGDVNEKNKYARKLLINLGIVL